MVLPTTDTTFNAVENAGYSDNTVQTAYDLYMHEALNSTCVFQHFVTKRPVNQPHPGDVIQMHRSRWFSESTITGWKTPLDETTDVSATKLPVTDLVPLTPVEYGAVTATTKFLARRTLSPFDSYIAKAMADGAIKTIDEIIQDKIKAGVTEQLVDGVATENLLAQGTNDFEAEDLRRQFTRFEENNVPKWNGEFYAAVVHPRIVHDLRAEAGAGGWRVAKEYMNDGLLQVGGEVGAFEGFRFFSNNRVRKGTGASSAVTYNNYFFGYGGLAEAVAAPLQTVVGPEVDNLRRFVTLGWKIDADWTVFEPKAVDIVLSTSTIA